MTTQERKIEKLRKKYDKIEKELTKAGKELLRAVRSTSEEESQLEDMMYQVVSDYDSDDWYQDHRGDVADMILQIREEKAQEEEGEGAAVMRSFHVIVTVGIYDHHVNVPARCHDEAMSEALLSLKIQYHKVDAMTAWENR